MDAVGWWKQSSERLIEFWRNKASLWSSEQFRHLEHPYSGFKDTSTVLAILTPTKEPRRVREVKNGYSGVMETVQWTADCILEEQSISLVIGTVSPPDQRARGRLQEPDPKKKTSSKWQVSRLAKCKFWLNPKSLKLALWYSTDYKLR